MTKKQLEGRAKLGVEAFAEAMLGFPKVGTCTGSSGAPLALCGFNQANTASLKTVGLLVFLVVIPTRNVKCIPCLRTMFATCG